MNAKACRSCKVITEENACPICRGTELSDDFSGLLIVLDHETSRLAKKMGIGKEGRYALKIR